MNIDIEKNLNIYTNILIYGNIYNGKYTYIKNKLKNYEIIELCYIDFYYNNYDIILEKLKNKNTLSFFYNNKEKIILIREIEVINTKYLNEIIKKYDYKKILIGSGDCIKNINNLNIHTIKTINTYNYEIEKKNNYLKDKNIKIYNNKNNINLELYRNINFIFNKKLNDDDIINMYNDEKILFPLLIHENYKKIIIEKIKTKKEIRDIIYKISNIYNKFIKYENHIIINHKWYLYDILCLYLCKYINNIIIKKKNEESKIYKLNYTKILTKNSIKSKNKKNSIEIFKKLKIIHNYDNLLVKYINKILIINLKYNRFLYNEKIKELGYEKKDILKIVKNSNEYYFINNIQTIKKLI